MKTVLTFILFALCSTAYAQQIDSAKLAKAVAFHLKEAGSNSKGFITFDSSYRYVVNNTILTWKEYIAFPKDALPDKGVSILYDKESRKKYHAENKAGVVIFHD